MQLSSVSKRQIDFPDGLFRTDDFCDFAVKDDPLTHWDQYLYRPFLKPRLEEKVVLTAKEIKKEAKTTNKKTTKEFMSELTNRLQTKEVFANGRLFFVVK